MLKQVWAMAELIDQLAVMRQAFGYTGLAGSTPPLAAGMQPTASTSHQPDELLPANQHRRLYSANNAPHNERKDTGTSQLYICCL